MGVERDWAARLRDSDAAASIRKAVTKDIFDF
jgi:hypothetical protein